MPDQTPESSLALTPADRERLRRVLKHLGAWSSCARCGASPDYLGLAPSQTSVDLFRVAEAVRGVQERYLPAVIVMCLHCGAMYLHSTFRLEEVAKQLEEAADDD